MEKQLHAIEKNPNIVEVQHEGKTYLVRVPSRIFEEKELIGEKVSPPKHSSEYARAILEKLHFFHPVTDPLLKKIILSKPAYRRDQLSELDSLKRR
ncbi:MAG: hypothetical protein ACP5O3_03975 [Candidatus Micrarchaeia archaeon]|jgi:hypothetical protein